MNNLDMKNIIVLKDLPSNIIEEAIVILKDNKVKKKDDSESAGNIYFDTNIINEAQNVIAEYIERLEKPRKEKIEETKLLLKYKKLQMITILLTGMMIISFLISFI